jgi:hypothetical protein
MESRAEPMLQNFFGMHKTFAARLSKENFRQSQVFGAINFSATETERNGGQ